MENLAQDFIQHLPYVGVVVILLASGLGLPIPEDLPLLLAGYCCGIGLADIRVMLPVAFLAVMGGDSIIYFMGRRYGHRVQRLRMLRRYLTPARLARAEMSFHAHGGKTLFLARFMPGLRAAVYFSAGAFKIPFWKILVFDGTAAILSVPLWVLVAWYFADDIETVRQWSVGVQATLVAALVLGIGGLVGMKYFRRRRVASAG